MVMFRVGLSPRKVVKLAESATCLVNTQLCLQRIVATSSSPYRTSFTTPCLGCWAKRVDPDSISGKLKGSHSEFRNIYSFRFIVHTRVLSRIKIYQTLLTVGAVPVGLSLHNAGAVSSPGLAGFFGIASLATVMLYVMSTFFRRIVGIISVDKDESKVRISHLTFWGRRQDVLVDISEIVPLSDMSVKPNDIYQVIQFYEKPMRFFWFYRHGKNTDAEAIQRVFGKL